MSQWQDVVRETRESVLAGPWNQWIHRLPPDWKNRKETLECSVGCKLYMHFNPPKFVRDIRSALTDSQVGWDLFARELGGNRAHLTYILRLHNVHRFPMGTNAWHRSRAEAWDQLMYYESPPTMHGADLSNADMSYAMLLGMKMPQGNFISGYLSRACFQDSDLTGANFRDANLEGADLGRCTLTYANLRNIKGMGVKMGYSHLDCVDIQNGYLRGANLAVTSLRYADLRGADLSYADLTNADLTGAKIDHGALISAEVRGATVSYEIFNTLSPYQQTKVTMQEYAYA